jgi:hypothetical protein
MDRCVNGGLALVPCAAPTSSQKALPVFYTNQVQVQVPPIHGMNAQYFQQKRLHCCVKQ